MLALGRKYLEEENYVLAKIGFDPGTQEPSAASAISGQR